LFRVLLPAALVLFVVMLVITLQPRRGVHTPDLSDNSASQRVEGLDFIELVGGEATLRFAADIVEETGQGEFHLEDIRRLELTREDHEPLIVSADVADIEGAPGKRMMHFEEGVRVEDPEEGLVMLLPMLDVDEAAAEARSAGELRVEGSSLVGAATSLVYGLAGQPSRLFDLDFRDVLEGNLVAGEAVLLDGLEDVELRQQVRVERPTGREYFVASRARVKRPNKQLRWSEAVGEVAGAFLVSPENLAEFRSDRLEALWDMAGEVEQVTLTGDAEVRRGAESLAATSIDAKRLGQDEPEWHVEARGTVYVQGLVGLDPAWMRAKRLEAVFDAAFELRSANAFGGVSFDGPQTRAEGDSARLDVGPEITEIHLFSNDRIKARLARERTRVAAEQITTDAAGEHLRAERNVEATLLPATEGAGDPTLEGLFQAERAIHFVAALLEGRDSGGHLTFSGGVRAWQGEQNLSAERIELERATNSLLAVDNVTTRLPRSGDAPAASEADYIQVSAERLQYSDLERTARYDGDVRVRLVEGWMESARLEVEIGKEQSGIREIRAFDQVQIEFRDSSEGAAPTMIAGKADRLIYSPPQELIWMIGDAAPATVRRIGGDGGTTSGRVLRYSLALGTLEVDSDARDSGRIRTTED
jgi:lipopolysaccharide transport protein LptA